MPSLDEIADLSVIHILREAISKAGGNEVYFRGRFDASRKLVEVEALAQGTAVSVAAGMPIRPPWNSVLHNHPGGKLNPSDADVSVSAWLSSQEVAFLIIDNEARLYCAVTEPVIADVPADIEADIIKNDFSKNGRIALLLEGYEPRLSQQEMAGYVAQICNTGMHGVIEAPTGTGKTLAYLLPLVSWAIANGKRVLVSTYTINLQHQLFDKDIPFVRSVLTDDFKAVLVKGRSNYVCRRRVIEGLDGAGPELFPREDLSLLESLAAWIENSRTGDRSELSGIAEDLWDRVSSDADYCPGPRCAFVQECFFRKARRQAVEARVLVSNHALFCTDLAMQREVGAGGGVLPPVDRLVIDEAHNLEDVATDCFGAEVSANSLNRQLGRISRRGSKPSGILHNLARLAPSFGIAGDELAQEIIQNVVPKVQEVYREVEPCFDALSAIIARRNNSQNNYSLRLDQTDTALRKHLAVPLARLHQPLFEIVKAMQDVAARALDIPDKNREDDDDEAVEYLFACQQVMQFSARIEGYAKLLEDFPVMSQRDMVYWVEQRLFRGKLRLTLHRSPLSVREIMAEVLHSKARGVIYTSATLASDHGGFDFFANRIGLDLIPNASRRFWQLPTEFDYPQRVLFAVNNDFPEKPDADFSMRFAKFAHAFIKASRGRVFFLFTSWRMLLECWDATMAVLPEDMASTCLRQGDRDRMHLLATFRTLPNAVLFGTSSFWEGVDVKGDRLIAIVIVRLPFMVPDDPLVSARMQEIERSGRSSFFEYSLPHAVIRFRQGFGRLMRTREDYGVVVALDPRIVSKRYGQMFVRSLPRTMRLDGNDQEIAEAVKTMLARFE